MVSVGSAQEMHDAIVSRSANCDIIVKAAAVADYTPVQTAEQKMKKSDGEMTIALRHTRTFCASLARKTGGTGARWLLYGDTGFTRTCARKACA